MAECWRDIEEHEKANPGALEKRLNEVVEMLRDKKPTTTPGKP